MRELRGRVALVTGGSGGLGKQIAQGLAREGMNVVVSGRREEALKAIAQDLQRQGVRAEAVTGDLASLAEIDGFAERAEAALGPIDVLVNNAGVERTASFTALTRDELTGMVDLNLTAPMLLTHRLLPGMLARGRGHVVFIASLAGKMGPPYSEPYAATKAGLIGLTQSLRAEYADQPVGFSVVCPGFISGDGMYQRMVDRGVKSNRLMGETTLERVVTRTVDAIRRDLPETVESGTPIRPLLALSQVAPRLVERAVPRFGVTDLFRRAAEEETPGSEVSQTSGGRR